MARLRRLAHNLASGYMNFVVAALCALASVPLALHYLESERFALWALMVSFAGYISLVDLGMSGSIARQLVDHKDDKAQGTYGSLIKTGWLVLLVQGALVFGLGWVLAPMLPGWLKITPELAPELVSLLRWQCVTVAAGFATRMFGHLLHSHQRIDVANYSQTGSLLLNYALLWWFFHHGQGVFSFVWANLVGVFFVGAVQCWQCWWLNLFPEAGQWGQTNLHHFRELFGYGKDLFLVAVGTQLIMASQTIIITRVLGLQMAAVWAVGTKLFTLISQLIWRWSDFAAPAFSEMMVRGELGRLRERYRDLVKLTASMAGLAAAAFALCNSLFVSLWTGGKIDWASANDPLLGFWLVVMSVLHCHNGFVLLTKKIGFMRYVYFIEGLLYVGLALALAHGYGLPGVILASVVCSSAFSGAYGVWRISRYFGFPIRDVAVRWLGPMASLLFRFVPLALLAWWGFHGLPTTARLILHACLCGTIGLYLLLRYGVPVGLQTEMLVRVPPRAVPWLRRLFRPTAA